MKKPIIAKLRQIIREEISRIREVQEKDLTDYVVKDGRYFYVDREDMETGETLVQPEDTITFTYKGKKYTAEVEEDEEGRDEDVYRLYILNTV